ncbi:tRNA pseudouridine(38-40) synthase TruA [Candidatus Saganbacteria bacterium]|uniref:tRNA pseudouridine synthase A n=1 Tax=Candidatus Saganbacteria bacterium TaxID=2575572 RepID=A0A9D6YST2_UNCSA|nr:tRNA pseudouridine(38-40) synthase TruA [Candidatus Saganbacteria bacterium]
MFAYDGAGFCGFELQPGKKTIRREIEDALARLFKTRIKISGASRTDAGVHALHQIASFKLRHPIPTAKIPAALNSRLPEDIRVLRAEEVSGDFNARARGKGKEYEYLIYNGKPSPVHFRGCVWPVKPKLNLSAMRRAASVLLGKHDFSSFCAAGSGRKNFVRTLYSIKIKKRRINIWEGCALPVVSCKFAGNGFLYKMVRNMTGTLVEAGAGKISLTEFKNILRAKDRRLAGKTAPPQGLCLVKWFA